MTNPKIQELLSSLRVSSAPGTCPTCGEAITTFRDALSEKEFHISGMCQTCQDLVFDGKEEY